jgi:N-acetylmuramoyl-L-alanine amidase
MKKPEQKLLFLFICLAGLTVAAFCYFYWEKAVQASSFASARLSGQTLIIDAGHGGEDGGAVSISGAVESNINLAIALRLNAILGLYGVDIVMLRTEDISLHDDSAETIREKKVSDLHNRVDTIESIKNAT